jgi:protein-L-isoaspartate(D-aspartate) O-methyltransferase
MRRTTMVDTQIRPSDVTKFPIIEAMLSVAREEFVPDRLREAAYVGENLDLGQGRVMLEPRTLAKMLDALDLQRGDLVLDLGCGLGYSSAVAARLAEAVIAVESDEAMAEEAQAILSREGADNVILTQAALVDGAPQHGPYDAVMVQGGVAEVPEALLTQIKDQGRIACLFMQGALGVVRIGYKLDGKISWRDAFNASAPVLAGFEKQTEFSL